VLAGVLAGALVLFLMLRDPGRENAASLERGPISKVAIDCSKSPALALDGSDVLANTLTPDLVEAWLRSRNVGEVRRSRDRNVTTISGTAGSAACLVRIAGPNTSDGLAALRQGRTDIAMSPRQLDQAEVSSLGKLGDMRSTQAEHVVAIDALSVVVNPRKAIRQMSRAELADVLSGRVTTWSALREGRGGIQSVVPAAGSRAADTAAELLGPINGSALRPSSDAGVVEAVTQNPDAIGIVSFPAGGAVKTIAIGERGATAFEPTIDTIATQNYPLTRRLYYYASPNASTANTRDFLSYVRSEAGQAVVARAGYGGQNVKVVTSGAIRDDASAGYKDLVGKARQLNVAFRFRSGQSVLDNKALDDLGRLVGFLPAQKVGGGSPLILIGFADAQGQTARNLDLSRQRAEAVGSALSARRIRPQVVRWFGEEQPVGDNATVSGRERNRRVEVWTTR
jgi:phosphate transport system substrate-binding protein